jgi:hypothetical protein
VDVDGVRPTEAGGIAYKSLVLGDLFELRVAILRQEWSCQEGGWKVMPNQQSSRYHAMPLLRMGYEIRMGP